MKHFIAAFCEVLFSRKLQSTPILYLLKKLLETRVIRAKFVNYNNHFCSSFSWLESTWTCHQLSTFEENWSQLQKSFKFQTDSIFWQIVLADAEFNRYTIRSKSFFGCCCLHNNKKCNTLSCQHRISPFFPSHAKRKNVSKKCICLLCNNIRGTISIFFHRLFHMCVHRHNVHNVSRMVYSNVQYREFHIHMVEIPTENHVHGVHGILFADSFARALSFSHTLHRVYAYIRNLIFTTWRSHILFKWDNLMVVYCWR